MDRNTVTRGLLQQLIESLSARRAWIEILFGGCYTWIDGVALRKESVDRNIQGLGCEKIAPEVALRKESVDRNFCCHAAESWQACRSPQGERG